jgi:hypothetical protein
MFSRFEYVINKFAKYKEIGLDALLGTLEGGDRRTIPI